MEYGWEGSIGCFFKTSYDDWLSALKEHDQNCVNSPTEQSQIIAWKDCFNILQSQLKILLERYPWVKEWSIVFEYELPRERGRRPDVIILGHNSIYVLEFKGYQHRHHAHLDQVHAYARDLKNYHSVSHDYNLIPILVLTRSKDPAQQVDGVTVVSGTHLGTTLITLIDSHPGPGIDAPGWLAADYAPLPSLVTC